MAPVCDPPRPRRDAIAKRLKEAGVGTTSIHYPVPPHLSGAYRGRGWGRGSFPVAEEQAATVLSLPIGPHLAAEAVEAVTAAVAAAASRL